MSNQYPPKINGRNLNFEEFIPFMEKNEPVIITDAINDWDSSRMWVKEDGGVDWSVLEEEFGMLKVLIND